MKNLENAKELNELEVKEVVGGGMYGELNPIRDRPNNGAPREEPKDDGATGGW